MKILGFDLRRFIRYSTIGVSTFVLDLIFLIVLTELLYVHPVPAAGIAFLIAISLNYILSRKYVFNETTKSRLSTYVMFIALGVGGLGLVMGLMYAATVVAHWNFLTSRVFIAVLVGILNYFLNLYINFQIDT